MTDTIAQLLASVHQQPSQPPQQYNALITLAAIGDDSISDTLADMMRYHLDWGVRQGAAWAAGQLHLHQTIDAIQQVITREGEDEQVRYVAALALCYVDPATADSRLQRLIDHPNDAVQRVAESARHALPYMQ